MFSKGIRTSDGMIRAAQVRPAGYTEAFSVGIVKSGRGWDLHLFSYALGGVVAGSSTDLVATLADTNLNVAGRWSSGFSESDEADFPWLGMEWSIPCTAPARYQDCNEDYPVTMNDVQEFANRTLIRLYMGGDKPFVSYMPWSVDIRRTDFRFSQRIMFKNPISPRRLERFWLDLSWPVGAPVFGVHARNYRGALPVMFRLVEQVVTDPIVQREAIVPSLAPLPLATRDDSMPLPQAVSPVPSDVLSENTTAPVDVERFQGLSPKSEP